MNDLQFALLTDRSAVARHLSLPPEFPAVFLATPRSMSYREMYLPKRNPRHRGEFRRVHKATNGLLRTAQKQIAAAVVNATATADCVHGFVHNRSIVTNAAQHLAARFVLHVDIQNFFDNIGINQVKAAFASLGAGPEAAEFLAELSTLDGALVQGASSSPAIANLVCVALDRDLQQIANLHQASYTRYSDDLTFSGPKRPDPAEIERVLTRYGFRPAPSKTRHQHQGRFQYVTGLSVTDATRPRAPKRLKRWLRSAVHVATLYGIDALVKNHIPAWRKRAEIARIDGSIAFLYSIEPVRATQLDRLWQAALDTASCDFIRRDPTLVLQRRLEAERRNKNRSNSSC